MANTRIDNRYEIREVLGKGGMGIVYSAFDPQRQGFVALKTMRDATDPVALEMFRQEWTTLTNICHPNIVDILHVGEFEENHQRKPYFVMPLLRGQTLDKVIRDPARRLSVERVVYMLDQTCRGLQAAHAAGLIHRDLKPSNLFVIGDDDAVKIIDFGMVHLSSSKNSVSGIKGTLQYMSPEQLDRNDLSPATDIFSLGIVAYEALTGRNPFDRGSEEATIKAIRNDFPAPLSDANPSVNRQVARVISKALAKNHWNRFATVREFGDYLQRALKGENIDLFDPAKTKPRLDRARKVLEEGDYEYAREILDELKSEGHVDSEVMLLDERVRQAARDKAVQKLLDSARTRLRGGEYALAWQRVQEALQKDPGNKEAQALQAEIETRRNDQQIEQWRGLVHQHLHNHAFAQAWQALEEIRKFKPDASEVFSLTAEVDRREKQFRKSCEEKEREYESALRSYQNGDLSAALSKFKRILDPDDPEVGLIEPERDQVHREAYNKIQIEWEQAQQVVQEIRKAIETGALNHAAGLVNDALAKAPNDLALQALKLRVGDLLRQEKSAFIADTVRRVDGEPDLDRAVHLLEEALAKYPGEAHLQELATSLTKRRDLVNSIVAKARQCEEQNLPTEALVQWNTLRSIHPKYPGWNFEVERVQQLEERQKREEAKANLVNQIENLLQRGEHERAKEAAVKALVDFPEDPELLSLERLAVEAQKRSIQAVELSQQAENLSVDGAYAEAIALLRRAKDLDPHNLNIRNTLASTLATQARALLQANDWRAAETLIEETLSIDPSHTLAKSLRPSVLLAKRSAYVDNCLAQARDLQASGDITKALSKVQEGLTAYPNDSRLSQRLVALRNAIAEQYKQQRNRDLEEMRHLKTEVDSASDRDGLGSLVERSDALSGKYPADQDFSDLRTEIHKRMIDGSAGAETEDPPDEQQEHSAQPPKRKTLRTSATQVWRRAVDDVTPYLKQLNTASAVLRAKLQGAVERSWGTPVKAVGSLHISRKDAWKWTGISLGAIVVVFLSAVWIRSLFPPPPQPRPPIDTTSRVSFAGNIEGSTIKIGDLVVAGNSRNLRPGAYTASILKSGYKPLTTKFSVGSQSTIVPVDLEPEQQLLRIAADVSSGQVLLDGHEVGTLQDGNFAYSLPAGGSHSLELIQNHNRIFAFKFEGNIGRAVRLNGPVASKQIPVLVVSTLGAHAFVYASAKGSKVSLKNEEPQVIPSDGRELNLAETANELAYNDGTNSLVLPIEFGNAPTLMIRAGTAPKGTLSVEVNIPDANIFINDHKNRRRIQRGKWTSQLDPAVYRVRVAQDGYEDATEQTLTLVASKSTVAKFDLKPAVKSAFLRVDAGTADATLLLDGHELGKLDSSGSFGPVPIAADVDHVIRMQKNNYEPVEFHRKMAVKGLISLSGAVLRPFGMIVLDKLEPSDMKLSISRQDGSVVEVRSNSISVPEATYTIIGSAAGYITDEVIKKVIAGRSTFIELILKVLPPVQVETPEVNQLFDHPDLWKRRADGFWLREGTVWFKESTFEHTFEFSKIKKSFNRQEKIVWRIYFQGSDYIECEIDGSNYSRRDVIAGHEGPWTVRIPHKLSQANSYTVKIKVDGQGFLLRVGQAKDNLQRSIEGRTALDGKIATRLIN